MSASTVAARETGGTPSTTEPSPARDPLGEGELAGQPAWGKLEPALALTRLARLMDRTDGHPDVVVALVDGPVDLASIDVAGHVPGTTTPAGGTTTAPAEGAGDAARTHGTLVGGLLASPRDAPAPGLCPGCTLLPFELFTPDSVREDGGPVAEPHRLATAVVEAVRAGAWVINLSVAVIAATRAEEDELADAADYAMRRGAVVVAAAGNEGTLASSVLTRHPWVVPVCACDSSGRPAAGSNLSANVARRGVLAPGDSLLRVGPGRRPAILRGTSAAAPFVTAAVALLWSEFRSAGAPDLVAAVARRAVPRRSVVPPLLDAWDAHDLMSAAAPART